jgi:nucleoside-diphosphate-sugar epimerase
MRVLLTGATGFLGSHVLRQLLKERADVAVLLRPDSDRWRIEELLSKVTVIEGDLKNIEDAGDAIRAFRPEAVCHLAWSGVQRSFRNQPLQFENVARTARLVLLAAEAGCRTWLGFGSQAEYKAKDSAVREDDPLEPDTLYGASKLAAGQVSRILCAQEGIRWNWLRVFSAYGPMEDAGWLIPHLMISLARKDSPPLSEGLQKWDYLYVEDLARAVTACLATPQTQGVFNLGSGQAVPIRRIAEQVRDLCAPGLELKFGSLPRPGRAMHLQADISKLREATGWAPSTDLNVGLKSTFDWYERNLGRYLSTDTRTR